MSLNCLNSVPSSCELLANMGTTLFLRTSAINASVGNSNTLIIRVWGGILFIVLRWRVKGICSFGSFTKSWPQRTQHRWYFPTWGQKQIQLPKCCLFKIPGNGQNKNQQILSVMYRRQALYNLILHRIWDSDAGGYDFHILDHSFE
jgi:hypothetical protein